MSACESCSSPSSTSPSYAYSADFSGEAAINGKRPALRNTVLLLSVHTSSCFSSGLLDGKIGSAVLECVAESTVVPFI